MLNNARVVLASTLVAERRWTEALQQYDAIRAGPRRQSHRVEERSRPDPRFAGGPICAAARAQDALQVSRNAFDSRTKIYGQ